MVAINPGEAAEDTISLVMLVTGAASAARAAKELMSTPQYPIGIESFRVKFNLACQVKKAVEGDVTLGLFGGIEHIKASYSIAEQLGMSIDVMLKEQILITEEADKGKNIGATIDGGNTGSNGGEDNQNNGDGSGNSDGSDS